MASDGRTEKLQRILDSISAHMAQPAGVLPVYSRQKSMPVSVQHLVKKKPKTNKKQKNYNTHCNPRGLQQVIVGYSRL